MRSFCSACPVRQGECQICGTFWTPSGGKFYGIRPVDANPMPSLIVDGRTVIQAYSLNALPNVVGPMVAR